MRIPFVAGNWKMNLSVAEAVKFLQEIKANCLIQRRLKPVSPPHRCF